MPNMLYPKIPNLGATGSNPVGCTKFFRKIRSRVGRTREGRSLSRLADDHCAGATTGPKRDAHAFTAKCDFPPVTCAQRCFSDGQRCLIGRYVAGGISIRNAL
jgi:hypothetical protein